MRALAPVLPERVGAGVGNLKVVAYSGFSGGQHWVYMDIQEGSYGGRFGKDGLDAVDTLYANTRNNPIEDIESHFPLRVTQYELLEDRGGPGRWRGGLGVDAGDRVPRRRPATRSRATDRSRRRPASSAGWTGRPARSCSTGVPTASCELPSKFPYRKAAAGDRLCLISPCGGGYGDPLERDRDAVQDDLIDGYVSRDSARTHYGLEEQRMKQTGLDSRRRDCGGGGGDRRRCGGTRRRPWTGAQANLNKHKAVPTFVAPGPAFDAKAKAGGKTIFIIPASSQVPFVSTIANHIKRISEHGRREGDDLAEPGPAVAVGAGHERCGRAEGERDRPARRQRPGRPSAPDQGREGEGNPDDRRASLRRQPALRAERRRPSSTSPTRSPAS